MANENEDNDSWGSGSEVDVDVDVDVDRVRVRNRRQDVFSDQSRSTQAIYEEIEVQHQSNSQSQDAWRSFSGRSLGAKSEHEHGHGGEQSSSPTTNWPEPSHYDNLNWSSNSNSNKSPRSKKNKVKSQGRSSIDSSKSKSSQEQSVSTWFPVPSLSMFQKTTREAKRMNGNSHSNSNSNTYSNNSSGNSSSRPLSTQSIPYDEMPQRDASSASSSFYSTSPIQVQFDDQPMHTHSYTHNNNTHSNSRSNSRNNNTRNNPPLSNPNNNRHIINNGFPRRRERPWRKNNSQTYTKHHDDEQDNDETHSKENKLFNKEPSMSPIPIRPSPTKVNHFQKDSSTTTATSSSIEGRSKQYYSSRSNSSKSSFMEQSQSYHSTNSNSHTNPFDSLSLSTNDTKQNSFYQPRATSKSPERKPIIKPTPSLLTSESKLHSLLSRATSPHDPQWMEALKVLANAPNPKQLAMMKIPHAHDWTALHIAALSNPPLYLIYGLLLVYPDAVRDLDSGGRLPIHLAAGSEASISVLSILVRFYDDSVVVEEGRGLIPLHLALLRDGEGELSADIIRVLLGQNLSSIKRGNVSRKAKDGCMRRGEHLNFKHSEVRSGVFGENPNAISMKERKKRENRMKSMSSQNRQSLSRGFARNFNDIDSSDGTPSKHAYLASLWEEEGVTDVSIFGDAELYEAETFSLEVQHCLKKLGRLKRTQKVDEKNPEDDSVSEREISPASILTPNMRLPIHMVIKRNHQIAQSFALPASEQNELFRILINADPSSLMYRDNRGKTPIITYLELADSDSVHKVDLETVELLLGMRTAGFRGAPEWLEDIDIVQSQQQLIHESNIRSFDNHTTYNPAMVPCNKTLPIHVAALKSLPAPIIFTVYSCFPGAKYIQDERKSSPLHCALEHESKNDTLDLDILCLLIDRRVARMKDVLNKGVLDLLIENGKKGRIPIHATTDKRMTEGFPTKDIQYQLRILFQFAILEAISSSTNNATLDQILEDLRGLPPWMRNLACGTPAVQKLLLTQVSSPISTVLIFANGLALVVLIISFISLVESVINDGKTQQVYAVIVASSLGYLALNGVCNSLMNFRLNIGWNNSVLNIWSWVTLFGLLFTSTSTMQFIRYEFDDNSIVGEMDIFLATLSIGLLWGMVIGYLSHWCYGISMFCLNTLKMVKNVLSAFAILAIVLLSFMQMIYLTQRRSIGSNDQCIQIEIEGVSDICSMWESIKISYFLAIGGEFVANGNNKSTELDILIIILVTVFFILILHTVAISIVNVKKFRSAESMVSFYWVPMFTHTALVRDLCNLFCFGKKTESHTAGTRSYTQQNNLNQANLRCCSNFDQRLGYTWEYICASFESTHLKNTKWWYLQREMSNFRLLKSNLFIRLMGIILIPIWLVLGLLTFGMIWPPQFRLWLFSWSYSKVDEEIYDKEERSGNSQAMLHEDVSRMKSMIFERFHDMQSELHDIKRVIA